MKIPENNIKLFLSYSWKNTNIADEIEKDLNQLQIDFVRDVRDLKYKSNISDFMKKIRETDYAVLLISEEYLKSRNCMHEVLHILKEKNYKDKILPIIIGNPSIYTSEGRIRYNKYWQEIKCTLEKEITSLSPTAVINEISELKNVEKICSEINEFLSFLSDIKNLTFEDLKKEGYKSILENIGCEDVSHLVSLLTISFIADIENKEIMLDEWFEKWKPTSDAYSIRAGIAKSKGEFNKAEINYKKALEMNPNNAFALNNYGFMLMGMDKEHDKARELFSQAIEIMPRLTAARLNLGCLLTDKFNDKNEARRQYEKIIAYNPTEERAYNNLANLIKGSDFKNKTNQKLVCDLYEKAIELNPKYIGAHLGYGNYLSEIVFDFIKAEREFDSIIEIDPASRELVETLKKRNLQIKERELYKNVSRNAPCPCGSGKKYKKCHLLMRQQST